jgi:menaquinone-dependent protoporphyrinogen oxidase
MKIAIIYASKYGATEKVAMTIAEKLMQPAEAEVFSLNKNPNPNITAFDVIVLCSSIYMGQVSALMKNFCNTCKGVLMQKKIALFVCGVHPEKEQQKKELFDAYPDALLKHAMVSEFLGGELLFEKLSFFDRIIARFAIKTKSNLRLIDWDIIDLFVYNINRLNVKEIERKDNKIDYNLKHTVHVGMK